MGSPSTVIRRALIVFLCALGAPWLDGAELGAQARGPGGVAHACLDCHLRKHDERTAVSEEMATSHHERAETPDFSIIFAQGRSVMSAECLECHSSAERRALRAREQPGNPMPVAGALLLGGDLSRDHPLGEEQRSPSWGRGLFGSGAVGRGNGAVDPRERLLAETSGIDCSDCHDPHSAFDALAEPSTARAVCLSCHDPAYYVFQGHITPSCGDCHAMHGAAGDRLMRARNPDDQCGACHDGLSTFSGLRVDPSLRGPPGHDDLSMSRCTECHRVHSTPGAR